MKYFLWCVFVTITYLGAALCETVWAGTLIWDRNVEADMKEYDVYICTPLPCTVQLIPAQHVGTVLQPIIGVFPTFPLPNGTEGKVAVTATDTAGNESGLSVSLPFDAKAPAVPVNPRLGP